MSAAWRWTGPDDLPAHVKSALIGASVTIPIKDGKLVSWNAAWQESLNGRADSTFSAPGHGKASGTSSSERQSTRAE
jgi:hypothetical protein